jgi:hypothetical protein
VPKYPLEIALRYIRLQFEKGVGRSIPKIITELVTNSDDSYKRMSLPITTSETFGEITIIANHRKRKISVIDHAQGISKEEMQQKFVPYGEESGDRLAGWRTRSLFGKGLRDVLFTQKGGAVRSIKNNQSAIAEFYYGRERGSKQEKPIVDVKDYPPRVDHDLRVSWGIRENGTCVEFRLRDDIRFPKLEVLRQKLAGFYMLRMINSNPSRRVHLKYIDSSGQETLDQIKYVFRTGKVVKKTLEMDFAGKIFEMEIEFLQAETDLSQGSAGYEDREGGLLILDEDDNVMDLTLFRYDNDPSASKLFGKLRINGAGEYIRQKLNSDPPEAILSEDREGFARSHGFYKKLAAIVEEILRPIIEEEEKKRRSQTGGFAPETLARYGKAIDVLNALYQQLVGKADTGNGFTGKKPKLPDYLEFVRPELTIKEKVLTPIALMINCDKFPQGAKAEVTSDNQNIVAHPANFIIERQSAESPLQVKILRIIGSESGTVGNVIAKAMERPAAMRVSVIDKDIFYPENGMEFNPSNINLREKNKRKLHLFVDVEKITTGSVIEFTCDSEAFELSADFLEFKESMKINDEVGCIELTVTADKGIGQKAEVKASSGAYSGKAFVQIVKEKEPPPPKEGGRFKPPRFEPIPNLRVQTWLAGDGTILINTHDPLNAAYFGSNPVETVEGPNAILHCQIRLADLVLDECLNQIVTDAYGKGMIERRYPNNPELDIRQHVAEWKFTYGKAIHQHFVTLNSISPSSVNSQDLKKQKIEDNNPSKV